MPENLYPQLPTVPLIGQESFNIEMVRKYYQGIANLKEKYTEKKWKYKNAYNRLIHASTGASSVALASRVSTIGLKRTPLKNEQKSAIFVNESGLYSLILQSKLESAKVFKRCITKDVLPSIRKTGRYDYCIDHKYNNTLTFKIENEMDLHVKVVSFLKKRYPHSLFTVTLGESQDTVHKRIDSFKKGYLRGSPDLIINNLHKHYTGFCIEFKSPKGNGVLSPDQSMILLQYQNNGFKTLVSNDYDHIIEQIIEYFRDVRILCSYCPRRFISSQSLRNHIVSSFIKCKVKNVIDTNHKLK